MADEDEASKFAKALGHNPDTLRKPDQFDWDKVVIADPIPVKKTPIADFRRGLPPPVPQNDSFDLDKLQVVDSARLGQRSQESDIFENNRHLVPSREDRERLSNLKNLITFKLTRLGTPNPLKDPKLPVGVLNKEFNGTDQAWLSDFHKVKQAVAKAKKLVALTESPKKLVKELPDIKLTEADFRDQEIKIGHNILAAQDLRGDFGDRFKASRELQIRNIEAGIVNNTSPALTELRLDIRDDYSPLDYQLTFVSPDGEKITQQLVCFFRQDEKGQNQFLLGPDGRPVALDARLYETKLQSLHDDHWFTFIMPRINAQGQYIGVVKFIM